MFFQDSVSRKLRMCIYLWIMAKTFSGLIPCICIVILLCCASEDHHSWTFFHSLNQSEQFLSLTPTYPKHRPQNPTITPATQAGNNQRCHHFCLSHVLVILKEVVHPKMNDLCDLLSSVNHKRLYFENQWDLNNIGPR